MATIAFTERSLRNHGRSWRSLSAQKTVTWEKSVSGLSTGSPLYTWKGGIRKSISYPLGSWTSSSVAVMDCSVSGYISLEIARAAGADMTDAAIRWVGLIPARMYAPSTAPAIVAYPPVMTAWISDRVMSLRYGRIIRGASVCRRLEWK